MDTKDDRKDVLIAARHRCEANQKEFAAWLGVSPQYLSKMELGVFPVSDKVMASLERVLSERGVSDAVSCPEEAALINFYRHLPPEARTAVNSIIKVLTPPLEK